MLIGLEKQGLQQKPSKLTNQSVQKRRLADIDSKSEKKFGGVCLSAQNIWREKCVIGNDNISQQEYVIM